MDITALTAKTLLQQSDDTMLIQHIRDLRRLADDSMSLLDDKDEPSARRNYSKIREVLHSESQQFKESKVEQISNLTSNYMSTIHKLSQSLPETPNHSNLYKELSTIYKKLHHLIK